jgi:hypothetical protein
MTQVPAAVKATAPAGLTVHAELDESAANVTAPPAADAVTP